MISFSWGWNSASFCWSQPSPYKMYTFRSSFSTHTQSAAFRKSAAEDYRKIEHNGPEDIRAFIESNSVRWNSTDKTSRLECAWALALGQKQGKEYFENVLIDVLPRHGDVFTASEVLRNVVKVQDSALAGYVLESAKVSAENLVAELTKVQLRKPPAVLKMLESMDRMLESMDRLVTTVVS